jgi:hypothetical protein
LVDRQKVCSRCWSWLHVTYEMLWFLSDLWF